MYEFLLVADVGLWLAFGFYYLRRPQASMFHPATYYLLLHFIVFVLRPILAYHWGFSGLYRAYGFVPDNYVKCMTLLMADLGFVSFMVATMTVAKQPFVVRTTSAVFTRSRYLRPAFLVTVALLLPIGLYSIQSSFGGLLTGSSTMVLDLSTGYTVNTTGNGYITDAQIILGTLATVCAWTYRMRLLACVPFLMFIVAKAGTGSRWPMVVAAFSLILFYLYDKRRKWPGLGAVVGALVMLQLFNMVGEDRGASVRALFSSRQAVVSTDAFKERPLESMDFGNMEFLEYLVWVIPGKSGTYNYFLDNLQLFTEPVPRVLWPGKPIGAPIQRIKLWEYGTPIGMTFSLPGEGWVQLGALGVIIWCGLTGLFFGWLYNLFMRCRQTPFQTAMYVVFLPTSIAFFRDGGLLTMAKTSLFILLPVLVWSLVWRIIDRPAARRGGTAAPRGEPTPAPTGKRLAGDFGNTA